MKNLSYVVVDTVTNDGCIVDPTWGTETILSFVEREMINLESVWLTHTHYDHIQGLDVCHHRFPNIPVFVHENELQNIDHKYNPSPLIDNQSITLGASSWDVIHVPGHSPGGICFYNAPHLICGDTIFIDGCGRADIKGANPEDLFHSLQKIKSFPSDTIIYPGHDYGHQKSDLLKNQIKQNRFLLADSLTQFIKLRMGR